MARPLAFTIDEVAPDKHVQAVCDRCLSTRYLTRPLLAEMAPGQTLERIQRRVKCIARKTPRGPACGGSMQLDLYRRADGGGVEARAASVEESDGLAAFQARMMRP